MPTQTVERSKFGGCGTANSTILIFFDFLVPDVRQFAQALLAVCDAADREEAVDYMTLPEKVFKPVKETL